MNHVTDIREAGQDASVLTDAGSGGLIGRGILSEAPLADHLGDDETPRYVLRNKKHGVTVERPDGTDEHAPDRSHSGAAVVSDVRVLFAAGRSGDDVTLSVSLADVVDVRTEDGLIGGAFVVETVDDERYRFPCRGDLDPVQEYLDAAVGVWTRAQRHVEEAREQVDRLEEAFESGNADVVLAATGDVEETLGDAREAADALEGARAHIDDRANAVREELAALERRANAEYAEQARERAHVRWDDQEYEAAMDNVDEASEAYAAAREIDADEPDGELLAERRETLTEERERLANAPVDRAEHAVDVAAAADDPGSAIEWWETAVERYETALSLDWGRDDRRFAGDPETLRDDLADAAQELVGAHCDHAHDHIAEGDDLREDHPEQAEKAYDRAADALAAAREVTRERVPDAADEVDAVAASLEDSLEALPGYEEPEGAKVDGGRTASVSRPSDEGGDDADSDADDASDGPAADQVDTDTPSADAMETGPESEVGTDGEDESDRLDASDADGRTETDDTDGHADTGGATETDDTGGHADTGGATETDVEEPVDDATEEDTLEDAQTPVEDQDRKDTSDREAETDSRNGGDGGTETGGTDPMPSEWWSGDEPTEDRPDSTEGTGETSTTGGQEADERSGNADPDPDPVTKRVTDPAAVDPDELPSLVARVFESAGWSTTVFGASTGDRYDLVAATDEPVSVTVCVWTLHPESVETVDAATVDRYAGYFEDVDDADAAVLCSAAPVPETARARAADTGFELLDADDLVDHLERLALDPEGF